ANARRDRQRQQRAQDAEQLSTDEQGDHDRRRRQPKDLAVHTRDDDATLELLVDREDGQHDQRRRRAERQRRDERRSAREERADVRQDVRDAREQREGERVRYARNRE